MAHSTFIRDSAWPRRIVFAIFIVLGWGFILHPFLTQQLDLWLRLWLGSTASQGPLAYPLIFLGGTLLSPVLNLWSWWILSAALLRALRTENTHGLHWYINAIVVSIVLTPFVLIHEIWLVITNK